MRIRLGIAGMVLAAMAAPAWAGPLSDCLPLATLNLELRERQLAVIASGDADGHAQLLVSNLTGSEAYWLQADNSYAAGTHASQVCVRQALTEFHIWKKGVVTSLAALIDKDNYPAARVIRLRAQGNGGYAWMTGRTAPADGTAARDFLVMSEGQGSAAFYLLGGPTPSTPVLQSTKFAATPNGEMIAVAVLPPMPPDSPPTPSAGKPAAKPATKPVARPAKAAAH